MFSYFWSIYYIPDVIGKVWIYNERNAAKYLYAYFARFDEFFDCFLALVDSASDMKESEKEIGKNKILQFLGIYHNLL